MTAAPSVELLNENCVCFSIERPTLDLAMTKGMKDSRLPALLKDRSNFFAETAVFVSPNDVREMVATAAAIESVTLLSSYREAIAQREGTAFEGPSADHSRGAFMGFDFHLSESGPRLIEINTNAGGAFVVDAMMRGLRGASPSTSPCGQPSAFKSASGDDRLVRVFFDEWRLAGREGPLRTVAIVDDAPEEQYLYPDMRLAQEALAAAGVDAIIVDACDLEFSKGVLRAEGREIDLVYNRLTDFSLTSPSHRALSLAWSAGAAVVTPSPTHHAMQADKRNLIGLSDASELASWGVSDADQMTLDAVPAAVLLTPENADELWARRKRLFFKPTDGFGGKAVYRGDKLTKTVWQRIREGGFVAQELVAPTKRILGIGDLRRHLKFDVRLFTHAGRPLSLAARLYQGQTTNFRTPGGGFAPVMVWAGDPD